MPYKSFNQVIEEIYQQDKRYKPDAYEFVMEGLHFTQSALKRQGHVSAKELVFGIRDLCIQKYGPMSKIVLSHWGITETMDFGNIVFNMIRQKLLHKTEGDSLEDFNEVYDFEQAFGEVLAMAATSLRAAKGRSPAFGGASPP